MTPVIILGYAMATIGAVLGVVGAILTASQSQKNRHYGFIAWLINAPFLIGALIGVSLGIFEPISAIILVPLNVIYFGTAALGFKNTKEYKPSQTKKDKGS